MKQIYAVLLSSVLSAGCSPTVTTNNGIQTSPEPIKVASLSDLAAETYKKVGASPDKVFPSLSDDRDGIDYGKFKWAVIADEQGLQYITKHKLVPVMIRTIDYNLDGKVDSARECFMIDNNDDGKVEGIICIGPEVVPALLETAQVMYGKMLRDTPAAMARKKVTADEEFGAAYAAVLPEKIRNMLPEAEQKAWGVEKQK